MRTTAWIALAAAPAVLVWLAACGAEPDENVGRSAHELVGCVEGDCAPPEQLHGCSAKCPTAASLSDILGGV